MYKIKEGGQFVHLPFFVELCRIVLLANIVEKDRHMKKCDIFAFFSEKYIILQINNINDIAFGLVDELVNVDAKYYP